MRLIVIGFFLLFTSVPVFAQRAFTANYQGIFSCGDFLDARTKGANVAVTTNWVYGYITAYNQYSSHNQVTPPEPTTLVAYLDKYCRENPLKSILNGATSLVADLGGWKNLGQKP